ncbi:MAG TPA: ABC transporter permease [Steroidobacteraceae bacterium]
MFRNYLAAALRNLARNRLYAVINVVGLGVGFAAAILVALYVHHELSFEDFIPGYQRIYRISSALVVPDAGSNAIEDLGGSETGPKLKLAFPQIEALTRLSNTFGGENLRRGNVETREDRFYWADPNFFDVVPLPALAGDLKSALERPDGLVLTRRMARKYFGRDLPLGETLQINRKITMQVRAVLADLPSNTHLNTEVFASAKAIPDPRGMSAYRAYTYMRLATGASPDTLRQGFKKWVDKTMPEPTFGQKENSFRLNLVPISAIHLREPGAFAMTPAGDPRALRAIAIVGVLILFIAVINFVNLMTARAARRAIEVGVRKAAGACRRDLLTQFMGESILFSALGMLLAVAWVELLLLPHLNALLDRALVFDYWHWPVLGELIAAALVVGLLAGLYPAMVLSAYRPTAVLAGGKTPESGSGRLRQALVVVQFAILIGLAVATGNIYRQTLFGLRQGLRFDKEQLLSIQLPIGDCEGSAFVAEVARLPGVRASACSMDFLNNFGSASYRSPDGRTVTLQNSLVGAGLFELLGFKPVAGRFFVARREADILPAMRLQQATVAYHVIVNETAARRLGFANPQDAIGKIFTLGSTERREIIGVVPDFSRDSVRHSIDPVFFEYSSGWFSQLNVKLVGREVPQTLQQIDRLWNQQPRISGPISRSFFDQYVQNLYSELERQTTIFTVFAAVALFLAALGLFGLTAFTVERRTREIGVRKALGAETGNILRLLLWQFARPVLWATAIAWPVTAWLMHRWLQGFAYRTELSPWVFIASAVAAVVIALLTVTAHAVLVARAKPVAALRYQ